MDVTKIEQIESDLTNLIDRRHDRRVAEESERPAREMWAESERRYFARQDEARQLELLSSHEAQARRLKTTLSALVGRHESEAEKYRNMLGGDAA